MSLVDLRSDTVTRPGPDMRRAMATAEVGDDVYAEDPTVNALEVEVAQRFGMAAAVYVPSGTMSNQISLQLSCPPGFEVLCDADAHIVSYEAGAAAALSGIQTRTPVAPRGLLSADVLAAQLRDAAGGYHTVGTRLIALEQTHNRGGGAIYPLSVIDEIRALATEHAVALHCDGARIWNAHVASGVALDEYGVRFDTMSVCFSKGLGAPVGSAVLLRDAALADEARELRHRLGGAMRQAGIIAAGALFALQHNVDRLADDHARAARLATELAAACPGIVDPQLVDTNIVPLDLSVTTMTSMELAEKCAADGVLVSSVGPRRTRLVTHLDVDDAAIDRALDVLRGALTGS